MKITQQIFGMISAIYSGNHKNRFIGQNGEVLNMKAVKHVSSG
jgi:hypothetical protein